MDQEFTVLENTAIGRNISMYRKVRGLKAFDIAQQLEMKEQTYLKYERGETQITVDFVQKAADVLNVDPLMLLAVSPNHIIDSGNNSPNAVLNMIHSSYTYNTADEKQTELISRLIETQIAMNEKILKLLDKK